MNLEKISMRQISVCVLNYPRSLTTTCQNDVPEKHYDHFFEVTDFFNMITKRKDQLGWPSAEVFRSYLEGIGEKYNLGERIPFLGENFDLIVIVLLGEDFP